MARTKPHHRTVEQQATWEAQQAADAREAAEAAARRTRRGLRASRDEVDEELILPVPNTELEEPGNHLTGRRRKTTLVLVLLLATLAIGSRGALWRRERVLWEEYCGKMLRSEFTRMYRMDPSTFAYLVDALSPRIDKNFFQAERAGGYISPQLRVAITIRWLAGGSYLDLKVNWGIATSTFYEITENVVDAIIATFPIEFDADQDALKTRAAEFAARQHKHRRVFKGVVGAVDGILIKVRCPWASEVGLPRSFYSRKGFFAINVQAVCDVRKRFIFVGMDMPGSSHDARAFGMCALWEAIQLGFIARGFYLLGDAAYRGICEFSALRIGSWSRRGRWVERRAAPSAARFWDNGRGGAFITRA